MRKISTLLALPLILIGCGEACMECKDSGEKYANGAWKTMPHEVFICQGEDDSKTFNEKIDKYRNNNYRCTSKKR